MPTFDLYALTPQGDLIGIMEVKNRSLQQTVDKLVSWLSTGNWEEHPIVQGEIRNTQTKKAVYAATYRKHPKMDDVAMVIPQRLIESIGKKGICRADGYHCVLRRRSQTPWRRPPRTAKVD